MAENTTAISFNYTQLESVIHSAVAAEQVQQQIQQRQHQRVFIIASRTLCSNTDVVDEITHALGESVAGVFSDIPAHTPRNAVMKAITAARQADADVLVSVGGGSVIDACKVVQLALNQGINSEQQLLDYAQFADGTRGAKAGDMSLFRGPSPLRQIAVPTTLSGAEHSNNAGVTDTEQSLKEGYRGIDLCPEVIIYDPDLSRHTPRWLWLSTAIRSLDHAIEGYCSADTHAFLNAHFRYAMELFAKSLPGTFQNPNDLQARSLNQQAVWLAGCGLGQVGHGASHGIGYMLGAVCGVPHGYTSCVMLPAVLEWNSVVNGDRQEAIASALGMTGKSAAAAVKQLVKNLGLPTSLQEVGVDRSQLQRIAELACKHPVVRRNPRKIENASQVMQILELAWESNRSGQ